MIGEPIPPPKWERKQSSTTTNNSNNSDDSSSKSKGSKKDKSTAAAAERVPEELIDELHARFLRDMIALFDAHKAAAGYPDAVLEVV